MNHNISSSAPHGAPPNDGSTPRGGGGFVDYKLIAPQQKQQRPLSHSAPTSNGGSRVRVGNRATRRRAISRHTPPSPNTSMLHPIKINVFSRARPRFQKLTFPSFFFLGGGERTATRCYKRIASVPLFDPPAAYGPDEMDIPLPSRVRTSHSSAPPLH